MNTYPLKVLVGRAYANYLGWNPVVFREHLDELLEAHRIPVDGDLLWLAFRRTCPEGVRRMAEMGLEEMAARASFVDTVGRVLARHLSAEGVPVNPALLEKKEEVGGLQDHAE
jgi:hypothetical protein